MCRLLVALLASAFSSVCLAQNPAADYATTSSAWRVAISPDGGRLAVGCGPRGQREICTYDLTGDGQPRLIGAQEDADIHSFYWASSEHLIYELAVYRERLDHYDRYRPLLSWSATTNQSVLLMNQEWGGAAGAYWIASLLTDDDSEVLMASARSAAELDSRSTDLRRTSAGRRETITRHVNLDTGEGRRRRELQNSDAVYANAIGETIASRLYNPRTKILKIFSHLNGRRAVFEEYFETDMPRILGLIEDNTQLVLRMPHGGGLHSLSLVTGSMTEMPDSVAESAPIIDRYSRALVGFEGWDHLPVQAFVDEELAAIQRQVSASLNHHTVGLDSWTADRDKVVVSGHDFGQPVQYYLFDRANRQIQLIATEADQFEGRRQPETITLEYPARDGLMIPAYLTLPSAAAGQAAPPPLVVMPHGGPESRDTASYHYRAAFLASLGYAVLRPNFRGSSGYGVEFLEAGYGEFGGKMIMDIIDGVRHVQREGLVSSGDYCAVGASYGGYAALMLALEDAGNIRCSVAISPVTYPLRLNREQDEYWDRWFGNRFQSEESARRYSPLDRASELNIPVLAIHGESDVQVPIEQSVLLAENIGRDQNFEFVRVAGANHYFLRSSERSLVLEETASFLARHLPLD